MRALLAIDLFVAVMIATTNAAFAEDVAVTFDDLPIYGPAGTIENARATTHDLLEALKRNRIPATGFVNEEQLAGRQRRARMALLEEWLNAGMDLRNHSYSHLSLSVTPVESYIADVARGEQVTKVLLARRGKTERWYRYPFLETGRTAATRHRFETWLRAHGYRIAPVTLENSDWEFADRYDEALARNDRDQAERVKQSYLTFTGSIVGWYRNAAVRLLGRQPGLIFFCIPAASTRPAWTRSPKS